MSQRVSMQATQLNVVRNIPLFNGLTEEEKDHLLKDAGVYSYSRKNNLFLQGDPVASFYVVCNGTVRLFRATSDGREVTTSIRIAGDTINEKEIFSSNDRHSISAMAIDKVEVMALPIDGLKKNINKYSSLSRNLISSISQSATLTEVEAEHQATMTAAQLAACYLQHLCVFYDFDPRGFVLPYKKSLIASRLGMELETFSRTLPKLKEHGITVKGPNVTFHDLDAVDRHTCEHCSINDFCSAYKNIRQNR